MFSTRKVSLKFFVIKLCQFYLLRCPRLFDEYLTLATHCVIALVFGFSTLIRQRQWLQLQNLIEKRQKLSTSNSFQIKGYHGRQSLKSWKDLSKKTGKIEQAFASIKLLWIQNSILYKLNMVIFVTIFRFEVMANFTYLNTFFPLVVAGSR